MPTKKLKVKTGLHGSLKDDPETGLRTTNEEARFPEEDNGVCGIDQLYSKETQREIRTTLEKIRNQIFKDEVGHNSTHHKLETKVINGSKCTTLFLQRMQMVRLQPVFNRLSSCSAFNPFCCKRRNIHDLFSQLEACRQAGAGALRNVAQRLSESYQTQSEEVRKKHEDGKHLLEVNRLEKEQQLKQHVENLNQVAEKLEEKHNQITELENLVQRMEREKKTLLEKKLSLENKLLQLKSNATYAKSCHNLQMEISLLQEKISHLQFVIHSQHQNLRSVIQEMEGLKNNLKEQDKRIENLKEKVHILEAQNKELKTKVALWSETPRTIVSKAVSTSELKTVNTTPYLMLIRLRK
ncbi:hypothetical protein GH733_001752 [Mirounga leonina]|nr:hypothetical protein GH733_001752 [Mirounga leonina]